ncbi:unnamed protein product [Soboliphyme baturini]|uniref:LIM zinc-binding domain-containing protein n=1 Tax=Soboliphyme baturini TaxID=241478 RepID=A0A183J2Q3_9BILA|nr:unnamed protein product [Soboliphyme baturini]
MRDTQSTLECVVVAWSCSFLKRSTWRRRTGSAKSARSHSTDRAELLSLGHVSLGRDSGWRFGYPVRFIRRQVAVVAVMRQWHAAVASGTRCNVVSFVHLLPVRGAQHDFRGFAATSFLLVGFSSSSPCPRTRNSELELENSNSPRRRLGSRRRAFRDFHSVASSTDLLLTALHGLIFAGEYTKAMSKEWHSGHFCCWQCDQSLTGQRYILRDDHPYCIKCYEELFANTCDECGKAIGIDSKGEATAVDDEAFFRAHLKLCDKPSKHLSMSLLVMMF